MTAARVSILLLFALLPQTLSVAQETTTFDYWYLDDSDSTIMAYGVDAISSEITQQIQLPTLPNKRLRVSALSPDKNWFAYIVGGDVPGRELGVFVHSFSAGTTTQVQGAFIQPPPPNEFEEPPLIDWGANARLLIRSYNLNTNSADYYLYEATAKQLDRLTAASPSTLEEAFWIADGSQILALESICENRLCPTIWSPETVSRQTAYDKGDFSDKTSDHLCNPHVSSDNRYIAYVSDCFETGVPNITREVYIYDTKTGQRNRITDFTIGTTLAEPLWASYSLQWLNPQALLISTIHKDASGLAANTSIYNTHTESWSLIEHTYHLDFVRAPVSNVVAMRQAVDFTLTGSTFGSNNYKVRIVDTTESSLTTVYEQTAITCDFQWSPDGEWIAFASRQDLLANPCKNEITAFIFVDISTAQSYSFSPNTEGTKIPLGWRESANTQEN